MIRLTYDPYAIQNCILRYLRILLTVYQCGTRAYAYCKPSCERKTEIIRPWQVKETRDENK
jgi:hypothetical protein